MEVLVIAIVRVLGSLVVLRWAFAGAVIAILVDLSDLFIKNLLDLGGVPNYQLVDKIADQVYLALFLWVALHWEGRVRTVAIALYLYRLPGFLLYLFFEERWLLFVFPNVFEFWFVFVAGAAHWWKGFRCTQKQAMAVLPTLVALKLGQEYVLHIGRWLDSFTAVEAVQAIWGWLTMPVAAIA